MTEKQFHYCCMASLKCVLAAQLSVWILFSSACAQRSNDPVQATQVNLDVAVDDIYLHQVMPLASEFALQVSGMLADIDEFCTLYTPSALTNLQAQWRASNASWFALSNYKFGPLIGDPVFPAYTFIDSHRLRGTNYIDSVYIELNRDASGDHPLTTTYFSSKTFQYLGLLPLEVLIFSTLDAADSTTSTIVNDYREFPRKCELLHGIAEQLLQRSEQIEFAWRENYHQSGQSYFERLQQGQLDSGETAITLLLSGVQEHLDYLRKRDVAQNVAQLADFGWESISASLHDIRRLLNGVPGARFTLNNIMVSAGYQSTAQEVDDNIRFALDSASERNKVDLDLALSLLDGNFKRNIPNALNVNLGINFTDGD